MSDSIDVWALSRADADDEAADESQFDNEQQLLERARKRKRSLRKGTHSSLPSSQDIQLLRTASARHPMLTTLHIATSYATLRRDGIRSTDGVLQEPPPPSSNPVLIAKYLLQLAIFLQEMQPVTYPELRCLAESPAVLTERCANTAINLVTRQDELLGSIESLEAVILESVYQCNCGRLRLSWMAGQRAMRLAQTMGLHLVVSGGNNNNRERQALHFLDPSGPRAELSHLWFRIVHYDLQLSRMLGLPPGAADASNHDVLPPYDIAVDTPEGYLEQVYRRVMVLALAQRSSDANPPDFRATRALDQELQKAANAVPSHWWLPPNLNESSENPTKLFWDMRRLIVQMLHHDLRSQLSVPHMLARQEGSAEAADGQQRSEMARIACVHSAREVLSRFILLRNFNRGASSCRFVNILGLMAAITLVLAHLGGRGGRRPRPYPHPQDQEEREQDHISCHIDALLAHQAPGDRAMMEQALETMRYVSQSSGDVHSAQSADVLQRLLGIEAGRRNPKPNPNNVDDDGDGAFVTVVEGEQSSDHRLPASASAMASASASASSSTSPPEEGERIFIPYFGVMRIVRPSDNHAAARALSSTTTFDADADAAPGARPSWPTTTQADHDPVHLVDPLLLDLRDENWMSQSIDMTFLDAFLEGGGTR
ncbi:hypothetical protein F4778DRAFT_779517 [Xylariomycetidae sp. FL2044]|nr:hypothetical protein F4778DRAFT_779517 [Xylariomycetidae sp. FL2044]